MFKNLNLHTNNPLRKQAIIIGEAGLSALAIAPLMQQHVWYDENGDELIANNQKFSLKPFQHVIVLGIGSGSTHGIKELNNTLGSRLTAGLVIDEQTEQLPKFLSHNATPQLSIKNVSITKELINLLQDCSGDDLIITVITGGNDLLAAPAGMMLEDKRAILNALIESGATPYEISTVKKHLSLVKGGNFAKLAHPASMINLIFGESDLTVKDETTVHDARAALARHRILEKCGLTSCQMFETPKEDSYFEQVNNIPIPASEMAFKAMAAKAKDLGFRISRSDQPQETKAGECWIGSGSLNQNILVDSMPEDGVFLTFGRETGSLVDATTLAAAKRSQLIGLAVENWAEELGIDELAYGFSRVMTPLAIYIR